MRARPTALGGKPDPNAPDDGRGRLNAREPEGPGKYRPEYKLSDADLDQRVVNVIAGEAQARNPESIDAVINNMLNRVGSKGWGPSKDLLQVATAPGQYAGNRAAGEAESAMIRERIRAIASGGLPDNTGGANAYRASWYNGPWTQKHARDGRVVGGNRYAYEPGVPNGPYAPYANPKEVVTPRVSVDARQIIVPPPAAAMRGVPNMTPGGFDPNRINPADLMKVDPRTSSAVMNSTTSNRSLSQTNSFNVKITGSQTPQEHAKAFTRVVDDLHALTLENIQSATV